MEKLINKIIASKCANKVVETIFIKDVKKYNIPSHVLHYDGINAPEGGIFCDFR